MKKSELKKYAKLIVKMGVNVQKGQGVVISASVDDAYFVKYVVEEAYKAKAKYVTVEWDCQDITRLGYKYQSLETLSEVPDWSIEKLKYRVETTPAMIRIMSSDPDGMSGINQEKLMKSRQAVGLKTKKYRDMMDNKYQWTIAAIPGEKWAKKIFPNLSTKKAIASLWDAIFECTRVNGDPINNWNEHNANIIAKCKALNEMKIKKLSYKSANGTDFTVELLPNTHFAGGGDKTLSNVFFNPNMPTEECFISPNKNSANGVVMSTKPLSVMGTLVDNFGFRFEEGKIVEVIAQTEEAKGLLNKLISMDEGARMLGEVALVSYDSPINKTGLLFYNTLYDENACCHLAIGAGFSDTINNFETMTTEEIKAVGLNESVIHVDFMIGSRDLSIQAETIDGKMISIFENGTWAF